jgi:toxin-antitoxin system PIN domain toxin
VILVDANLLLYAEDSLNPKNEAARSWWDAVLSAAEPVCLCWPVLTAFVRIATNGRVFARPLTLEEALARVQSWLDQPCVQLIQPTDRHFPILGELLTAGQAAGNLVSDAHLAALAVEHGCTLCSTDADFARFPRVRWRNPLR